MRHHQQIFININLPAIGIYIYIGLVWLSMNSVAPRIEFTGCNCVTFYNAIVCCHVRWGGRGLSHFALISFYCSCNGFILRLCNRNKLFHMSRLPAAFVIHPITFNFYRFSFIWSSKCVFPSINFLRFIAMNLIYFFFSFSPADYPSTWLSCANCCGWQQNGSAL